MTASPTKPSTPRLSEITRHVRAPKGAVSTGWPEVQSKCAELGIRFRPWQPSVGRLILAKRADGKYAATIGGTGLSIPRQVGKTFLVGAIVFALCLLRPNLTVIWTAHRLRTAEETFGKMQAFAKRRRIRPHILKIVLGSGEEAILFRNGSRILFGARESGFGLGFDEVDVLIFDEAQRLRDITLDDMIPATNQSRQPSSALLLFMGTPPGPTDSGEVFAQMRHDALTGDDEDTGWVEFGADPNYEFTPLPAPLSAADWKQISKANPSFPEDTPREAILRMRKKLGPDSFKRNGAGIWDEIDLHLSVIGSGPWAEMVSTDPPEQDRPPTALAVAMSLDRVVSIAGAWADGDEVHVELLAVDTVSDTIGAVEWVAERAGSRIPVVIRGTGPEAAMIPALKKRRVRVVAANETDVGKACGGFFDAFTEKRVHHAGQDHLDKALPVARKRPLGKSGAWVWDGLNISPVMSVTLAHYGASIKQPSAVYAF